jgi:hypothetical protein
MSIPNMAQVFVSSLGGLLLLQPGMIKQKTVFQNGPSYYGGAMPSLGLSNTSQKDSVLDQSANNILKKRLTENLSLVGKMCLLVGKMRRLIFPNSIDIGDCTAIV